MEDCIQERTSLDFLNMRSIRYVQKYKHQLKLSTKKPKSIQFPDCLNSEGLQVRWIASYELDYKSSVLELHEYLLIGQRASI